MLLALLSSLGSQDTRRRRKPHLQYFKSLIVTSRWVQETSLHGYPKVETQSWGLDTPSLAWEHHLCPFLTIPLQTTVALRQEPP